jgi:chorismate mutase
VPINGIASLTLSIDVFQTEDKVDEMISNIEEVEGVHYAKIIARE